MKNFCNNYRDFKSVARFLQSCRLVVFAYAYQLYFGADLSSIDTIPRIAPMTAIVPPIVPATIPSTSSTIAQTSLDTNLDPITQTIPMTI